MQHSENNSHSSKKRQAFVKQSIPSNIPGEQPKASSSNVKNTPAHATVGFHEGQKILVEEMIQEEEKKLKKIKPLWKVSNFFFQSLINSLVSMETD